jgi:hypothetical protein
VKFVYLAGGAPGGKLAEENQVEQVVAGLREWHNEVLLQGAEGKMG